MLRGLTPHIQIVSNDVTRYASLNVPVVADLVPGAGALGGLYTALIAAPTDPVMVMACDMPFVTAALVSTLIARVEGADAAVPVDARGRHPVCAAYARRAAAHFKQRIERGELRLSEALDGLHVREVTGDELAGLDTDGLLLLNVNTPADYDRAAHAAHGGRLGG